MPPKPKFTRDQLQATALDIIDKDGLGAFSVRNLASRLGTGPMTIYNYVRSRDELEALVADAVMSEAQWPKTRGSWQQDVRAIAKAMWLVVRRHPGVIPLILSRRSLHDEGFEPAEALLQALSQSGRSGKRLLIAFTTVTGFVFGLAQTYMGGPLLPDHEALPADRFHKLIEMRKISTKTDPDDEFRAGLDIIMAGLTEQ